MAEKKFKKDHMLYDNFLPQIKKIEASLAGIQARLQEQIEREPLRVGIRPLVDSLAAVVEAALVRLSDDLQTTPLTLEQWTGYIDQYLDKRRSPGIVEKREQGRRHEGERRIVYSEMALDAMNKIVIAMQDASVPRKHFYHAESVNRKLIVAIALLYTAERLE